MSGPNTADQVGPRFDIIIDGYGYVTARAVDPNLPFRVQQSSLEYTPTFLERTNVSGNYGDETQSFFLTASQNDWSSGEQQRFFRAADKESVRKCWRLDNVNVRTPGQVTLDYAMPVTSSSLVLVPAIAYGTALGLLAVDNTNLYQLNASTHAWNAGSAHGAGTPNDTGNTLLNDGSSIAYIGGTTSIRKYDGSGPSFANFGAVANPTALAEMNNTLYATDATKLYSFDTSGTPTTIFTWKTANGGTPNGQPICLTPFGGKLLALFTDLYGSGPELWIYDGSPAPSTVARFAKNFVPKTMAVVEGTVLISGVFQSLVGATTYQDPCVMYFANGTIGELWRANNPGSAVTPSGITDFDAGAVWIDTSYAAAEGNLGRLMYWNPSTSAISCRATLAGTPAQTVLFGIVSSKTQIAANNRSRQFYYPGSIATSGTVTSSLIDFDNSLTKLLRGVKVDYDAATDGDGGSVDIAYQLNTVSGSFTNLQTAAVSGTEYPFTGAVVAHSVAVRITLNKGTSTAGPTLKRDYVRAVPVLQAYRANSFILDLGGAASNPVVLRDGTTPHPLTGEQMRQNLAAAITSQTPISITDVTGTYTGILEPAQCEFDTNRPAQYYARVQLREV